MQSSHVCFGRAELFTVASMDGSEVGSQVTRAHVRGMTASATTEGGFLPERSEPMQSGTGTICRGFESSSASTEAATRPDGRETAPAERPDALQPHAQGLTTSFSTAATFVYALGAGITAAAGTRLALQLILIAALDSIHCGVPPTTQGEQGCYGSSLSRQTSVGSGQFARLLLALAMVAVS
eukprot:CAMPEP_0174300478 /NCGR_PEP_ID=MMETSP0809-20121228/58482_1 /TAXON_ID=73025 ORGANISM="Eutreptiella gymnastica-like, Strain CCMP1594" /NCGR_SAMPLE_ID=MMETSP0809 /ASSEMBLY_ACC=CAM_ASM_000658 /LENGTH=181 /DNA_ID=CAMNT_0015406053 /DNA_START=1899 /DNA_END=2446 /DNA_ORIENTATION=-